MIAGGTVFGRIIELEIGKLGAEKALSLKGLHVDFVVKDGEGVDSTAEINIYNISKATYTEIKNSSVLVLSAGHETGNAVRIIFVGQIISIVPFKNGGDIKYTISCKSGAKTRSVKVSKTYTENISVEKIMKDLTVEMGLSLDVADRVINKFGLRAKKYDGGLTVYGKASEELKEIANDFGLELVIEEAKAKLIEKGGTGSDLALSLSMETGMLSSLKPTEVNENKTKKNGWSCISVLMPELSRGSKLIVVDPELGSGTYRVVSRVHTGSNYSESFYTESELVEVL